MAMTNVNLDLGRQCGEDCPQSLVASKYYPSFTFEDPDDKFEGAPKQGKMTVEYKIRRSVEVSEGDGTERCTYYIEVVSIVAVDGAVVKPAGLADRAGDALDALARALEARHEAEGSPEDGAQEPASGMEGPGE